MIKCPDIEAYCDDCIKKMIEEHDAKVRADAIDECIKILVNIMPSEPFMVNSKHHENWKIKTTELRMLRGMYEQLKGETE